MTTIEPDPITLVVDDEEEVADAYALRLRDFGRVDTVYDGRTALERVDTEPIDIVLLDRHMPGMSGDDVLARLNERDFSGRVIMVTAIDPGFDVLDMPFDDYLCKPVDRDDICTAVEQQATILGYETLGDYFAVESKRRVIAAELSAEERADHEQFSALADEAETLRERADRLLTAPVELIESFEAISREGR